MCGALVTTFSRYIPVNRNGPYSVIMHIAHAISRSTPALPVQRHKQAAHADDLSHGGGSMLSSDYRAPVLFLSKAY